LLNPQERKQVVQLEQLWVDIGAKHREQASALVRVGDPITLDLKMRNLVGDLVCGPGMDNKSGMWTVMEALRRASLHPASLRCRLHSVATVQEEIGLRGAKTAAGGIDPAVAIAVDVTHATDCPSVDKTRQGDIKLGAGPVIFRGPNINPNVASRLIELAERHSIAYQLAAIGRATSNDANVLQLHGAGVATGLVAIPNRYMHSAVEVISMQDIDRAADLLTHFAQNLAPEDDFVPR
jgi:endoglucanase